MLEYAEVHEKNVSTKKQYNRIKDFLNLTCHGHFSILGLVITILKGNSIKIKQGWGWRDWR